MLTSKSVLFLVGTLLLCAGAYAVFASKRLASSEEWTRGPSRGCNLTERTLDGGHSWAYCFFMDLLGMQDEPWVHTFYKCRKDAPGCPPASASLYVGMETRSYNYLGVFFSFAIGAALLLVGVYAN